MTDLSSLAKTIILNHINTHQNKKNNIKNGRPCSFSNIYILDRILFILTTGSQWSKFLEKLYIIIFVYGLKITFFIMLIMI